MAAPLGDDEYEESMALEQLSRALCGRVVAGNPFLEGEAAAVVAELRSLDPDDRFFRSLTVSLTEAYLHQGLMGQGRTSTNNSNSDTEAEGISRDPVLDTAEPRYGSLSSPQMAALLEVLCVLAPLSGIVAGSALVGRLSRWLWTDALSDEVAKPAMDLTVTVGATTPSLRSALIGAVTSVLPAEPPKVIMQALAALITARPTESLDVVMAEVDKPGDEGTMLLLYLTCVGATFPAESTTRLLTKVLERVTDVQSVHAVVKTSSALCVMLPHSLPCGNTLAEQAVRSCVVRLLQWPRTPEDTLLSTDAAMTTDAGGAASTESESRWVSGLVRQVALSLLQACYWTYPVETLACVRGLSTEHGSAFAEIRQWMMETPIHAKLVDRDSADDGDPAASAAFVASQCAPAGAFTVLDRGQGVTDTTVGNLPDDTSEGHDAVAIDDEQTSAMAASKSVAHDSAGVMRLLEQASARARARRQSRRAQAGPVENMLTQLREDVMQAAPESGLGRIHRDLVLARIQVLYLEYVRSQQLNRCRSLARRILDSPHDRQASSRPSSRRQSESLDAVVQRERRAATPVTTSATVAATAGKASPARDTSTPTSDKPDPGQRAGKGDDTEPRAALQAQIDELVKENKRLREEQDAKDKAAAAKISALEQALDVAKTDVAMLKCTEDVLTEAADERHDLWSKMDDLTQTCLGWEDAAADFSQIVERYKQLHEECFTLRMERDSAVTELSAVRAEVAEKKVELAANIAENAHLQECAIKAVKTHEQQTDTMEKMQVLSADMLRTVERKYATQKHINLALQRRILELSAAVQPDAKTDATTQHDTPTGAAGVTVTISR
eukprot:m.186654 g.186654  ORF g.186654 m.186654 type:complete len:841 (-) comp16851_c0_seq1:59-2581(-)